MNKIRFAACQTFGSAFDLGMVQAGFDLVHKAEREGGFGTANALANRHLLGYDWTHESGPFESWHTPHVDVVVANPPCSGFSLMSRADFRGVNSPVNSCMWATEHFIARTRPLIAIFESVGQTFTQGLPLLRALREKLEVDTGEKWHLTHLLHNNIAVGGAAIRKRYFWVVSRIPFGVEIPIIDRLPTNRDVLSDLEGLASTYAPQPYRRPPTWWSERIRAPRGLVDGHYYVKSTGNERTLDLLQERGGVEWNPSEIISVVAQRYVEKFGHLPASWNPKSLAKWQAKDWNMGHNQTSRWNYDKHSRVVTGAALGAILHPTEPRYVTHREVARIQGFPDDWKIEPNQGDANMGAWWGKGIPVNVGHWVGGWIKAAIEGNPGSVTGTPIGELSLTRTLAKEHGVVDRETVIDAGKVWHAHTAER